MKKILSFLLIGLLVCGSAFAIVYNFEGSDRTELLYYVFNATTGHDHDGVNSKYIGTAGASIAFEGATENTYETTVTATDPVADATVTIPNVTGRVMLASAATAITAGATPTLTIGTGNQLYTDTITTDNQDQTITFSGAGTAGDRITIIFVTDASGSGDEIITFHGTLVRSVGTLTLANAAASRYVIQFVSDGSKWNEVSRTAVQAA